MSEKVTIGPPAIAEMPPSWTSRPCRRCCDCRGCCCHQDSQLGTTATAASNNCKIQFRRSFRRISSPNWSILFSRRRSDAERARRVGGAPRRRPRLRPMHSIVATPCLTRRSPAASGRRCRWRGWGLLGELVGEGLRGGRRRTSPDPDRGGDAESLHEDAIKSDEMAEIGSGEEPAEIRRPDRHTPRRTPPNSCSTTAWTVTP